MEGGGRVGTGWVVLVAVGDRCRAALGDGAVVGQVGRRSDVGDRDGERGAAGVAVLVRDVRGDRVCPVVVVGVGAEAEIALTRRAERVAGRAVTPVDLDVPRAVVDAGVGEGSDREGMRATLGRSLVGRGIDIGRGDDRRQVGDRHAEDHVAAVAILVGDGDEDGVRAVVSVAVAERAEAALDGRAEAVGGAVTPVDRDRPRVVADAGVRE